MVTLSRNMANDFTLGRVDSGRMEFENLRYPSESMQQWRWRSRIW